MRFIRQLPISVRAAARQSKTPSCSLVVSKSMGPPKTRCETTSTCVTSALQYSLASRVFTEPSDSGKTYGPELCEGCHSPSYQKHWPNVQCRLSLTTTPLKSATN